jgi:hypothetical protein
MKVQRPRLGLGDRRNKQPASKRERAARDRSSRARQHLERVRGGQSQRPELPVPSLSLAAPIAVAVSLIIGAVFGSPLIAAAGSWIAGEPIRLESISVSGASRLSLEEIGQATSLPKGVSIDEIDPGAVEANLREHPWIADASVVQLPTSRLLIGITERVARAVVGIAEEPEPSDHDVRGWRVVSSGGLAFATASESDVASLPKLLVRSAPTTHEPVEALADAIELASRFEAFGLPTPSEVIIDEGIGMEGWIIRLPALAPRVILGRDDLDARITALAELVGTGRQELAEAETIDLRFAEQAVLRNTPSPKGTAQAATSHGSAASPKPRPTG